MKPVTRKCLKILAVLVSLPLIVLSFFLIRYYYLFNRIIADKLGQRYQLSDTEIYAAPTQIHTGQRMKASELVAAARRLGYVEEKGAHPVAACSYSIVKPDVVLLRNDAFLPEDSGRSVEVRFSGNTIASIRGAEKQGKLEKFSLRPEVLSNLINENRERRRFVAYKDLPKVVVNAVLAAEDRRFFTHRGIDPIRIIKALIVDVREGDKVQGGSTLTQQFVKNYFLTPERTWKRKLTDAYMSILLEQRLSKEEIFELYCNEVYLGQRGSFGIVGLGEASDAFFNKSVKDLTLGEAATLAGIIPAPNRFAPHRYADRAVARRNMVLDFMAECGFITPQESDQAKARALEVKPGSVLNYSGAPYFVDYVQDALSDKFGDATLARSNYKVHTTLNLDLQRAAYEAVRKELAALDTHFAKRGIPPGTVQASLIAVDPRNGHILAMVGGRDYGTSQFNRITQSKRQPGSIFKPFVYAAALETAYRSPSPLTAASSTLDAPTQFAFGDQLYEPRNFKEEYSGQVTMRQAVTRSLNIATIKFAEKVGFRAVVELARRLGLNEQIRAYPASAIGAFEVTPIEMAGAYTAFANGGQRPQLLSILKILDRQAKPVYVAAPGKAKVLTPEIAFLVTSLLESVINHGTGAGARSRGFSLPAAGKTGTSHDGWFAGYTQELLCITWVGFDDNRELNLSGSQAALPIWTSFMKRASSLYPLRGEPFAKPEGIVQVEIDPASGLLATAQCLERYTEYFIKGSEPSIPCIGNSYEQMLSGGSSIYSSSKDSTNADDINNGGPRDEKKISTPMP